MNPGNASTLRITAAAGTELAGAISGVPSVVVPRSAVYTPRGFIPQAASLRQAFAHCGRFLTAASRRSGARVSVPLWPAILSDRLPVVGLVSRYLTNCLMGRGPIRKRREALDAPQGASPHGGLARVSPGCPPLPGRSPTRYSPVRRWGRANRSSDRPPHDLHVLGTLPAFTLSQDQTLRGKASQRDVDCVSWPASPLFKVRAGSARSNRQVSNRRRLCQRGGIVRRIRGLERLLNGMVTRKRWSDGRLWTLWVASKRALSPLGLRRAQGSPRGSAASAPRTIGFGTSGSQGERAGAWRPISPFWDQFLPLVWQGGNGRFPDRSAAAR